MGEREDILRSLEPLFERARREGLWFHCTYQDLWFHPDDLAKMHQEGRFVWGAVNWRLRDPEEKAVQLAAAVRRAQAEEADFLRSMHRPTNEPQEVEQDEP